MGQTDRQTVRSITAKVNQQVDLSTFRIPLRLSVIQVTSMEAFVNVDSGTSWPLNVSQPTSLLLTRHAPAARRDKRRRRKDSMWRQDVSSTSAAVLY